MIFMVRAGATLKKAKLAAQPSLRQNKRKAVAVLVGPFAEKNIAHVSDASALGLALFLLGLL